jgi:hypothetical protein
MHLTVLRAESSLQWINCIPVKISLKARALLPKSENRSGKGADGSGGALYSGISYFLILS